MTNIVLIQGANPASSRKLFDAIIKNLPDFKYIELRPDKEELTSKIPKGKFILIGKSAGGKIVLEYQLEHKDVVALVLLSPAVYAEEKYSEIKVPTLIMHSNEDPTIPFKNSQKLQKILTNSKLVEISNNTHSYIGKEDEVAKVIADWIRKLSDKRNN